MKRKVIGGLVVCLVAAVIGLLLLIRPLESVGSDGKVKGARELPGSSEDRSKNEPGMRNAKHRDRSGLHELLPTGVRIEAEEIRGSTAKGKVRVIFPDGMQIFAGQLTASSNRQHYVAEGKVMIWLGGGKACVGKETGPLEWWFDDNGRLRIESNQEGITTTTLPEPQSEEKIRELSESSAWFFVR